MKKLIAFTLTEVMITVGIIGVISALTVPTLIKNYQKKAQVVQFRKNVAEFESAVDMFITEEGKTSFATTSVFTDAISGLSSFMQNKFKAKPCNNSTKCFADENYISIDGTHEAKFECDGEAYLLANSAAVCVKLEAYYYLRVFIDTNGAEGPNIGGRDMFRFYLDRYGQLVEQPFVNEFCTQHSSKCTESGICLPVVWYDNCKGCESRAFGEPCFGVLRENNWEMTY